MDTIPNWANTQLRNRRRLKRILKKLAQTRTDIIFLSACKRFQIIPKGLRPKNNFQHSNNTYYQKRAQKIYDRTGTTLRNLALNNAYAKQKNLQKLYHELNDTIHNTLPKATADNTLRTLMSTYYSHFKKILHKKNKKLNKLIEEDHILKHIPQIYSHKGKQNPNRTQKTEANHNTDNTIMNLSSHTLNKHETAILQKGLSYCPTNKLNPIDICYDMERYLRRIRLEEYFANKNTTKPTKDGTKTPYQTSNPNKGNITWTPPKGRNQHIDQYITQARQHLDNFLHNNGHIDTHKNLSKNERIAITTLKNNKNITIIPADKGGSTTIMDTKKYIEEAETQLDNKHQYKPLPIDPTNEYKQELINLMKNLSPPTQTRTKALIPSNPTTAIFYTRPKIHKLPKLIAQHSTSHTNSNNVHDIEHHTKALHITPPGRPIIAANGTLTESLSGYIDNILNPLRHTIPTHIKDTTHFLNEIQKIGTLPEGTILATMDVVSLYTNIPHKEGIQACREFLTHNKLPIDKINDICHIICFILTHNNFQFNKKNYLQTRGTAMGTKMAPSYADIFMHTLETKLLKDYPLTPTYYYRYIDDIFLIWTHGLNSLLDFHTHFNSYHQSIKFSIEHSTSSIPFLDVTTKLRNNTINTTLYTKPTDNHTFLNYNSNHPYKLKKSIIYSACIRLRRICEDQQEYIQHTANLARKFLNSDYPIKLIKKAFDKASSLNRQELLQYKPHQTNDRIPMVFHHGRHMHKLTKLLTEQYKTLQTDPTTKSIFKTPPINAKKQPPNLRNILTASRKHLHNTIQKGNKRCNKPRCQICSHIHTETEIKIPYTNITIHPPHLTCDSANIIYYIYCTQCTDSGYVGETSTPFRL